MTILAVDDRPKALSALVKAIRSAEPEAEVYGFSGSAEALRFARELCCDAAFLDIDMPEMDGLELAGRLRALYPRINIIFVTGFTEYTGEAISQRASGYVTKPVTPEKIREELDNLRYPVEDRKRKRVRFRCFGNFEVFWDEKPMCFKRGKTKELLAYLVDRRTLCTNSDIIASVWEGGISDSYFRTLRLDLTDTFSAAGCGEVIIQRWASLGINEDEVSCDFYDWQAGRRTETGNVYLGEYMSQHSWAEYTNAQLGSGRKTSRAER